MAVIGWRRGLDWLSFKKGSLGYSVFARQLFCPASPDRINALNNGYDRRKDAGCAEVAT